MRVGGFPSNTYTGRMPKSIKRTVRLNIPSKRDEEREMEAMWKEKKFEKESWTERVEGKRTLQMAGYFAFLVGEELSAERKKVISK